FPPEFRNRIDEVVLFSPLMHGEVREIAGHYLGQITLTLARAGKTIAIDPDALELIVRQGYSLAYGARFLKRTIDERIKLPISTRWNDGAHFRVRVVDDAVVVEASPTAVMSADSPFAYGDVA